MQEAAKALEAKGQKRVDSMTRQERCRNITVFVQCFDCTMSGFYTSNLSFSRQGAFGFLEKNGPNMQQNKNVVEQRK